MGPLSALRLLALWECVAIITNVSGESSSPDEEWEVNSDNRTQFWCPERCTCSYSAKIVDCSGRGLTYVPKLAISTTRV